MTTPMAQLKNQFADFQGLLGPAFQQVSLNHSPPKALVINRMGDRTDCSSRGVKSDFIKIYTVDLGEKNAYSMAFSFAYLDVEKNEPSVRFSIKSTRNKKITASDKMALDTMKMHLINVNKALKEKSSANYKEVLEVVCLEFLPHHKLDNLLVDNEHQAVTQKKHKF